MKKELLFAFIALFLMSLTAITGVYAIEPDSNRVTFETIHEDITGDGIKDEIYLQGIPDPRNENVYKTVFFRARLSNGKTYEDKLKYGIKPDYKLIDFNHDNIKDVFLRVPTGQSDDVGNYYLFTAKDFLLTNVPIPELDVQGQFTNGYKAKLSIPASHETYVFDLMIKKEMYDSLGMYQNGKLTEPTELIVQPYGKLQLFTNNSNFQFKGIQKINGTSKSDIIGVIESTWNYTKGSWKLMKAEVKEIVE